MWKLIDPVRGTTVWEGQDKPEYKSELTGWLLSDGVVVSALTNNALQLKQAGYLVVSPPEAKLLFTPEEWGKIEETYGAKSDLIINYFMGSWSDLRLKEVNFNLDSVRGIFPHLLSINFITQARYEQLMQQITL